MLPSRSSSPTSAVVVLEVDPSGAIRILPRPAPLPPQRAPSLDVMALAELAELLHLAVAVGEYLEAGAIACLAHLGNLEERAAQRFYRRHDPDLQANTFQLLPGYRMRPLYGMAARIWDHRHNADHRQPVMPELYARYGEVIFRFA